MYTDMLRYAVARFSSSGFARSIAQTKGPSPKWIRAHFSTYLLDLACLLADVIYYTQLPLNNLANPLLRTPDIPYPGSPAARHAAPGGVRCEIPYSRLYSNTEVLTY